MHVRSCSKLWTTARGMVFVCVAFLGTRTALAQQEIPQEVLRTDKVDIPTAVNQPPDANVLMKARERQLKLRNFDKANAVRIKQIADEAGKLLILARDLNRQMENVGEQSLPPALIREIEVIQILAHDVQSKMTLTVGAS